MYTAEVPRQNARAATGDPFNAPVMTGKKNSQLFQCQRYSVQRRSVLHVKPRCQAGATPSLSPQTFMTVSLKCHGTLSKKCQKKSRMSSLGSLTCQEVFEVSLVLCLRRRFIYLCCRFERTCAWGGSHIPPPPVGGGASQVEEGEKSSVNTSLLYFHFFFFKPVEFCKSMCLRYSLCFSIVRKRLHML